MPIQKLRPPQLPKTTTKTKIRTKRRKNNSTKITISSSSNFSTPTRPMDQNFPLNFIMYPAFYSGDISDDLLDIISNHIVNETPGDSNCFINGDEDKIADIFYETKLDYPCSSGSLESGKSSRSKNRSVCRSPEQGSGSRSPRQPIKVLRTTIFMTDENAFPMAEIITPNEKTSNRFARKIRVNTTTSLLKHNLQKTRDDTTLTEAKKRFKILQQVQRREEEARQMRILKLQQELEANRIRENEVRRIQFEKFQENFATQASRQLSRENSRQSSIAISPTLDEFHPFVENLCNDTMKSSDRNELRSYIQLYGGNNSLDLLACVSVLQSYFKRSNRFVRIVNKKSYGFTMKITKGNKDDALQFIEDLERSPELPIHVCVITFKKTHYNFHVSCVNPRKVENVVELFMKKHVGKLSIKMFVTK